MMSIKTNSHATRMGSEITRIEREQYFLSDPDVITTLKEKAEGFEREVRERSARIDKFYAERARHSDMAFIRIAWLKLAIATDKKGKAVAETEARRYNRLIERNQRPQIALRGAFNVEQIKDYPIGEIMPSRPKHQTLQRATYLCPLHNEKTPSFVWFKDKNRFKCFGCQAFGSVIDLQMKLYNQSFKEACQTLQKQ